MRRAGSSHPVAVLVAARRDVRKIVAWYQVESPHAAAGFRAAFSEALIELAEAPLRWATIESDIRRYLLLRYPYKLLYTVKGMRVVVVAVVHHARRPGIWRRGR